MLFWVISIFLLVLLIIGESFFLKKLYRKFAIRKQSLEQEYKTLLERKEKDVAEIAKTEDDIAQQFLFYDIARRVAPFLEREPLLKTFSQELRYLDGVSDICFGKEPGGDYQVFKFGQTLEDRLCVKTDSAAVIEYIPIFVKLLGLCIERVKLYQRLQELSIHDSLTAIYNRRYFTIRYLEEFDRAQRFNLVLSFLMIDIDNFKKINDTYGHLVGDVVLRNVAKLILKNLREMDFVARFGGEEFAVILPETDKAGAIMVAERISSRISHEHIHAFDELLTVTVSVGVASFPQNTLHSDVLVEIADKALYKAKISGRNRVCWF